MNRIGHAYLDMKFRNKILLSMMITALIPFLLFSAITGTVLVREVLAHSSRLTQQLVRQTSESLDVYLSTLEELITAIATEGRENQLNPEGQNPVIQKMSDSILRSYPEIAGITIAYEDDSYFVSGMSRISRDRFSDEDWYRYAVSLDGHLGILGDAIGRNVVSNLNYSSDSIFSVVKSFHRENTDMPDGVVLVDIRDDILEQLVNRVSIGEKGFLYVTDGDSIVYTPPSEIVYRIDNRSFPEDGSENSIVSIEGKDYMIANHVSDYSGWRVVGVMPRSEFSDSVRPVYAALGIGIGVGLLLVILFSIRISASVTRPVSKLSELMETVEEGDFSVRFNSEYRDEIGVLGQSFNHMLERIDGLIRELYEEKQVRLEAQLKSLQEQIKPHFLYNTLDTISWLARKYDAQEVVDIIDALTNMFRLGLSKGRDYITLKEERTHVANYLYIQKWRYSDKMNYEIDIPEEYDDLLVPKLILQPLVENAIYHGIKSKRGGGTIRIYGVENDGWLNLCVEDDGAGIEEGHLEQIRIQLENPELDRSQIGFGMFYIAERVRLYYGEGSGVKIDSVEGEFTRVTLVIPLKEKADE